MFLSLCAFAINQKQWLYRVVNVSVISKKKTKGKRDLF